MPQEIDERTALIPEDRTAVIIDGPAFLYMARRNGVKVDYNDLRAWLDDQARVTTNHFHAVTSPDTEAPDKIRKFLDFLRHNGWSVRDRPGSMVFNHIEQKQFPDQNVTSAVSADIARLLLGGKIEQILLVGHDPKYADIVEVARDQGVRVVLMSSKELGLIDKNLLTKGDGFIDFVDVCEEFSTADVRVQQVA